jgi:hypothetical protein
MPKLKIPTLEVECLDVIASNSGIANVKAAPFGALGDGSTDDTTAIQAAIDSFLPSTTAHDYGASGAGTAGPVSKGCVYLPPGTYIVKNVVLRSGIRIVGAGRGVTTIKLKNNTAPSGGATSLVGNVFTTTLDATGNYADPTFGAQTWQQGASSGSNIVDSTKNAGKYGTQTSFIVSDVSIESLTIDGNKANNGLADGGGNSSVMGAGVAFMQTLRGVVRDCVIQNCRLDGVTTGYTLHGGSYSCKIIDSDFVNNGRCGVAMTTGYGNHIEDCRFTGSGSSDIDIEANWNGEVNAKNVIANCTGDGPVQISSATFSRVTDVSIIGGQFARLFVHVNAAAGLNVSGVNFEGNGTGAAISVQGFAPGYIDATYYPSGVPESAPLHIAGCEFRNFATLLDSQPAGGSAVQMYNLVFDDNTFDSIASSGANLINLYRPYKCVFNNNRFTNCGHADGTSVLAQLLYAGASTFPTQGQNQFTRNRFTGARKFARLINLNDGSGPPSSNRNDLVCDNIGIQPIGYGVIANADTNFGLTVSRNDWRQSVDETATPIAGSAFVDFTLCSTMTRVDVTENRLSGFAAGVQGFRTMKCKFSRNKMRNMLLGIYAHASATGTFAGQGDNDISGNEIHAAAAGSTFGIQLDVGATFTAGQTVSSRAMANAIVGFGTANLRDTTVNGTYVYATAQVAAS